MSIKVECGQCGRTLKVRDESAGKRVKCPDCGAPVQIPNDVLEAVEDDPWGDDSYEDPFGGVSSRGDALQSGQKPCPICGEYIKSQAAKCRFCGEIFDPKLKKQKKKEDIDEDMTTGDWVVAIICSGIGCIAGIVWMIQGKPKGTKMLVVSLVAAVVWNVIRFAIAAAQQQPGQAW